MTHDIAALGARLQLPSVLLLWIAVLVRSPTGLRAAPQRGVWLAVAAAAAAMTLNLPAVLDAASGHSATNVVAVTRNSLGVLSAGAVLYFVARASTGTRRLGPVLALVIGSVLAALLSLALTAEPHLPIAIPEGGPPAPSPLYWLILINTHLVTNIICVLICLRYGARSTCHSLAVSLYLFGLGTALVGLYWLGNLIRVVTDKQWPVPWLPLLMDLHGILRAAAILVPTFSAFWCVLSDIATAWRLWPMWHDLVTAVPHVALAKPRSRIWDVLWPQVSYQVLAYRRVIETRDAILALNAYAPHPEFPLPDDGLTARDTAADSDAVALASIVKKARDAKLRGLTPPSHTMSFNFFGSADLTDEKVFLLRMAKAYETAPPPAQVNTAPMGENGSPSQPSGRFRR